MVYFILKGKGFYENDYRKREANEQAQRAEQNKKVVSYYRERDAQSERAREEAETRKTVDFRETPNAKEIMKIGKEVNRMKELGEAKGRINKEYEKEVHKLTNHND